MTLAEWDRVVYGIDCKLFLAEWQENGGGVSKAVKDKWELKIALADDTERVYSGETPLLEDLKNLFLKGTLLKEREPNGKYGRFFRVVREEPAEAGNNDGR